MIQSTHGDYVEALRTLASGFELGQAITPATLQDVYHQESLLKLGYFSEHQIGSAIVKKCRVNLPSEQYARVEGAAILVDKAQCQDTPLEPIVNQSENRVVITSLYVGLGVGSDQDGPRHRIGGFRTHDLDTMRTMVARAKRASASLSTLLSRHHHIWADIHEHFEVSSVERTPILQHMSHGTGPIPKLSQSPEQFYAFVQWLTDDTTVNPVPVL